MKQLMKKLESLLELGGVKKDVTLLVISGVALLLSLTGAIKLPINIAWVAIILCGVPIILEAIIGLITEFDIKADVLVSLALIASVCIGEDFAAGEVAFIMQLGALLEDLTVAKARAGIEKLVKLTPQTARIIENNNEKVVAADQVKKDDIIRVLPGESIPVDGVIISGQTSINQAVMTGESLPVDKTVGDEVSSGTVNQFGVFEMKATRVGEDSSIQRMIKLVQSADAGKAKIVGIADRWATWIVIIALSAAALTWLFSGQIIRAVTILVVFCPCALVLATPTAIMAAIGNATKHGFLVREGDALERLSKVKVIAFDKTGTLTCGKLTVTAFKSVSEKFSDEDIFSYTAAAEILSEHPIGKAIVTSYKEQISREISKCEDFKMTVGRGVASVINGKKVFAGNSELLKENDISVGINNEISEFYAQGSTVIYIGIDGDFTGYIVLSDVLRNESSQMITKLTELGVVPVLLTGDNKNAAESIAKTLHISEYRSECLPEDKLKYIDFCKSKIVRRGAGMRSKSPELMSEIKKYIEDYYLQNRQSPSTTKIVEAVGIARGTAYKYLIEMAEKNMIEYDGQEISTNVTRKYSGEQTQTPIVGSIPCGSPQYEEENIEEYVSLPTAIFGKGDFFILRASGQSMIEAGMTTIRDIFWKGYIIQLPIG